MLVIRVYLLDRRALWTVAPPLWVIEAGTRSREPTWRVAAIRTNASRVLIASQPRYISMFNLVTDEVFDSSTSCVLGLRRVARFQALLPSELIRHLRATIRHGFIALPIGYPNVLLIHYGDIFSEICSKRFLHSPQIHPDHSFSSTKHLSYLISSY